ncbi:sigma-70 family RNA polymerase sigma factor [Mucilaginibacter sp. KACC 22773]|uniref:sigma-70 family RNA polymerase sigma factor n=1 Tax=Mucilaginibacter sp. KACC 22773 TaxID=3025671 RepID=UPI002366A919|nr:sigma-70 family RNA polymerase sigma factor [Mucilaginibacter sp. KACC 22773]WDF77191.1 sigma-70 family RNA polymerase sigma factor [Mucilaginibacter sp. KACC 22773]
MTVKNYSDPQLVASLQKGEEAAMTEIYDRYWKKLLGIAYNHTHDKSSAQEIVQEVLIKLWDRRDDIQINSLPNYLAMSVKYMVINHTMRERRRSEIAYNVIGKHDHNYEHEQIYAQFLKKYIGGVVEVLPEKCKLVFKASRESGKNIREIAQDLNIAEKTVEAHLTKALKSIKYSLKSAGIMTLCYFSFYIF